MKRVIVVPIIHNAADLGSLAESVRAHYVELFGPAGWDKRERAVRDFSVGAMVSRYERVWQGAMSSRDGQLRVDCDARN